MAWAGKAGAAGLGWFRVCPWVCGGVLQGEEALAGRGRTDGEPQACRFSLCPTSDP